MNVPYSAHSASPWCNWRSGSPGHFVQPRWIGLSTMPICNSCIAIRDVKQYHFKIQLRENHVKVRNCAGFFWETVSLILRKPLQLVYLACDTPADLPFDVGFGHVCPNLAAGRQSVDWYIKRAICRLNQLYCFFLKFDLLFSHSALLFRMSM